MQNEKRDRLIELIQQADAICSNRKRCEGCVGFGKGADCVDYHMADHLIAHGVTFKDVPDTNVGEWVSVKDRLPEETQCFLVVLNNEDIDIRVFNSKNEPFQSYSSMLDKFLFLDDKGEWHTTDRVTHWMPLPQAPKGE